MKQNNRSLTDAQLKKLYFEIATHYRQMKQQETPLTTIHENLQYNLQQALGPQSGFDFDAAGQLEAYQVLNTFWNALPDVHPTHGAASHKKAPITAATMVLIEKPTQYINYTYTYHRNDLFWDWMLIRALVSSSPRAHNTSAYSLVSWFNPAPQDHSKQKKNTEELYAFLAIILILAVTAGVGLIALYYLLSETADSIERMMYSEGWLQAAMSLSLMAASGVVSFIIADALAAAPLMELAITAGLANPAGAAVFGVVCLTVIGAAGMTFAYNWLQSSYPNHDAIDAQDPHRFVLTPAEEQYLRDEKHLDPLKVRCAMVALRAEIETKTVPSLLNRSLFNKYSNAQHALDSLRRLRRGELKDGTLQVGEMTFDCKAEGILGASHQRIRSAPNREDLPTPIYFASAPPSSERSLLATVVPL